MKLSLKWLSIGIKNVYKFEKVFKILNCCPLTFFMPLNLIVRHAHQFEFDMPVLKVQAAHAIRGLGILGFDYLRTQKPRITSENYHFEGKLA